MRGGWADAAGLMLVAGLAACSGSDDPAGPHDAATDGGEVATDGAPPIDQPVADASVINGPPAKLDLVLVIDNSIGMGVEQEQLGRSFSPLLAELQKGEGGAPDLRVAVLSSNYGAGALPLTVECDNYGDGGRFQVRPGCGLAPGARWLSLPPQGNGNFSGQVSTVLDCLVKLGTSGCGFEHHLQSLRVAFSPLAAASNSGFLRDDALLGVIILADEDDCSAEPEATFFNQAVAGQGGSLRCALKGHLCGGQPLPPTAGFSAPLATCTPQMHADTEADRRDALINVSTFVSELKALKNGRDDRITVSAIIGWDDGPDARYRLEQVNTTNGPSLQVAPICNNTDPSAGIAAAGVRLRAFAQAFRQHTVHSICAGDLHPTMTSIGRALTDALVAP